MQGKLKYWISAAALAATPVFAAKTELSLATIAPVGTPWYDYVEQWADRVAELSNNDIQINIFHSAQLGNEWETWTKVQRGRVDIGVFSGAVMAEKVPPLSLMSTPFLFDDEKTIYCVYDTQLKQEFTDMLEEHAKVISWAENGWGNIYAKDDLSAVEAAEGYKSRVAPHAMSRLLWGSANANSIEVPFADTPAALQTDLIRSGEATPISYMAFGLYKVAPHYMLTQHMHQAGAIMMSPRRWTKLDEASQRVLIDAVPDINVLRSTLMNMEQMMIAKLKSEGVAVHELSDAERDAWKQAVQPNYPAYVEGLGEEAEALWPKVLEAKANCGE